MSQISRPMQIALAATLLLFAIWFVALRPKPTDGGEAAPAPTAQEAPTAPGVEGLTRAVDKADEAAATANRDAQRAEQSDAEGGAGTPATGGASATAARGKRSGGDARGSASRRGDGAVPGPAGPVRTALRKHKAFAIAFIDPATADARAVRRELLAVSNFDGRAVTVAVPIGHLSRYEFITRGIQVTVAPTVVIVAPNRVATRIVGAADRGEIEQRLADALTARR